MIFYVVELLDDWNVDVPSWKYPRNLESPRLWQRFQDGGNVSRDVTAQVASELQRRMRTGIFGSYCQTNRRSTASDLSRQLSSATGTTVSRQTVYRRLGHIGLYALVDLSDVFPLLQHTVACD
ncbi:HTH_Tnp_Tc3_2 domain-containing protein [Trichonephila clavipes]|nr:HTH_Tnp_Tc3_2 domain-containing protein [Trichonephila clavipes]